MMRHTFDNTPAELPERFSFRTIEADDDFASRVMGRIDKEKEGGFSSLSSASKVLFMSVTLLVYTSIGAFIGVQSHKSSSFDLSGSKKKALLDLRNVHHLDPVSSFDKILRPFETTNN